MTDEHVVYDHAPYWPEYSPDYEHYCEFSCPCFAVYKTSDYEI